MQRKPTITQLKKKLLPLFSKWVRLKAVKEARNEYIACCSCGQVGHWKNMDAGHFVNRRHSATLFDPRNVNPQCRPCNRYDEGNASGYARYLIGKYGPGIIDELNAARSRTHKFTVDELEALIAATKQKLKELE